ncbi:hypothetical protein V8E36_000361 [Tilletia maclaganii]
MPTAAGGSASLIAPSSSPSIVSSLPPRTGTGNATAIHPLINDQPSTSQAGLSAATHALPLDPALADPPVYGSEGNSTTVEVEKEADADLINGSTLGAVEERAGQCATRATTAGAEDARIDENSAHARTLSHRGKGKLPTNAGREIGAKQRAAAGPASADGSHRRRDHQVGIRSRAPQSDTHVDGLGLGSCLVVKLESPPPPSP